MTDHYLDQSESSQGRLARSTAPRISTSPRSESALPSKSNSHSIVSSPSASHSSPSKSKSRSLSVCVSASRQSIASKSASRSKSKSKSSQSDNNKNNNKKKNSQSHSENQSDDEIVDPSSPSSCSDNEDEDDSNGSVYPSVDCDSLIAVLPASEFPSSLLSESQLIGEGGFSAVYRCNLPRYGPVAIKRFTGSNSKEAHSSLQHELDCFYKLTDSDTNHQQHPNIIQLLAVCHSRNLLIFELMDFDLTHFLLKHRHSYSEHGWQKQLLYLSIEICGGLAFLHSLDMIHFDIKPANVLMTDDGKKVRIGDIGLAHIKQRSVVNQQTMTIEMNGGTEGYMAPEVGQEDCKYKISNKCDVYSVGCLFGELWSGSAPPRCETRTYETKLTEYLEELREKFQIPEEWSQLIESCLKKKPEQRPTMKQITDILQTFWER